MESTSTIALRTGNLMPVLGLGTWQLNKDTAASIEAALARGYRMIDTSGDYGTQRGIGEGIKNSGVARDDIYLITKVEEDEDAYDAVLKNLRELQTDYADLILIHRPPPEGAGEELWGGLLRAKGEGLTRDIGVSNYNESQIDTLIHTSGEVPAVNQVEWSPFGYSDDLKQHAEKNRIVIQAYSPLTRGTLLDDGTLLAVAEKHDKTPAQILLRWNLQLGTVPLPKANQQSHRQENLEIFDFELDETDLGDINALNKQYSALGRKPMYT